MLAKWQGFIPQSFNIDPKGGRRGQILFCEAEVKKLLVLPIVFWLSPYILSKSVDTYTSNDIHRSDIISLEDIMSALFPWKISI